MSEGAQNESEHDGPREWLGESGVRTCYITQNGLVDDAVNVWAFIPSTIELAELTDNDIGDRLKSYGPLRTYTAYVAEQHKDLQAQEVIAVSTSSAMEKFDALVSEYNQIIMSDSPITRDQVARIREIVAEALKLIGREE
jgi:hypothetical protein